MSEFSAQDHKFMQRALDLAAKGQYTTTPNPSVGCVLVKNGEIVGEGFHFKAGQPHAERVALAQAGENAKGATAYVTLEPCSHYGRTPPCALGLIEAGVVKVIAAMQDPNPQVAGKGLKMLSDASIESTVNLLNDQAEKINKGFLKRMRQGMPFVQLKLAMSLDGRTAMASGESKWITGPDARSDVQKMRAKSSALLSTSATVIADDPSLNVRWDEFPENLKTEYKKEDLRQPVRVILDSQHRIQPTHKLFLTHSPVWLVSNEPRDLAGFPDFCEQIILPKENLLKELMRELGKRQINTLWVEAGANLAGNLIDAKLVDELIIYIAPKLLGDNARGLCQLPNLTQLADAPLWQLNELEQNDKLDIIGSKVDADRSKLHGGIKRNNFNNLSGEELWFKLAYKNMFNHSTVIYKKSAVEEAGGYDPECDGFEDWHLWARMVTKDNALVMNTLTAYYGLPEEDDKDIIFRSRLAKSRGLRLEDVLE